MSSIGLILLIGYLVVINVFSFCVFALIAKYNIRPRDFTLPFERHDLTLILWICTYFGGGSLGALIAILLFRNKRERDYHNILIPIMLVIHIALLVLFIIFQDRIFAA